MSGGELPKEPYVLSVDIGTTNIRAHIYDKEATVKGTAMRKIELLHPEPGSCEIDEKVLLEQFIGVVKDAVKDSSLEASDITCMGITTLRNTFITWDRETGQPFHHFITWQDLRAKDKTVCWNNSYAFRAFKGSSKCVHLVSRSNRFLAGSVLKFMTVQVSMRLLWCFDNFPELKRRLLQNQVMFGTVDTWLLYQLTGGQSYATDFSNASSTGLYDTFMLEWSSIVCRLLGIPIHIFPPVQNTSGHFGDTSFDIFGASIPITCLVGDQQGAMFGECCFELGDVKLTCGTGTFVDLNTGSNPHASVAGLYPLVGWKIGNEITYLAEGMASDTGTAIEWAKKIGVFDDVCETSDLAKSVPDSGGVHFVSSFNGLQAPINDDKACALMLGMTSSTTNAHIVRAILESLAFRVKLLYEAMLTETKIPLRCLRADGGVTNNDFLMQLVADLLDKKVDRSVRPDLQTSLGGAFLAGLATGVWNTKEELYRLKSPGKDFEPDKSVWPKYRPIIVEWERALRRACQWYKH